MYNKMKILLQNKPISDPYVSGIQAYYYIIFTRVENHISIWKGYGSLLTFLLGKLQKNKKIKKTTQRLIM